MLSFSFSFISAQDCYDITDISFYPEDPCPGDSLFIIVDQSFCAICDCEIDSLAYNDYGIIFQVEGFFTQSECDFPCESIDTLYVSQMIEGTFSFNYTLSVDGNLEDSEFLSVQSCDPWSAPNEISTYPPEPCNTTDIAVIYDYIISGCDCITDSVDIDVLGSDITINHYTSHGICAAIFMCSDTFWLPILDSTFYDITYSQLDSYYGATIFSDSTTLSICGGVGQNILGFDDIGISVFPIPAKANITLSGLNHKASMNILSIQGQTIQRYELLGHHDETIDISYLAPGVYLMELEIEGMFYYSTFVKQE